MIERHSFSPSEAIEHGHARIAENAVIANGVRFVPFEDDGQSAGLIEVGDKVQIREGTIICSGVKIAAGCMIGHNVVLRVGVLIGTSTVVSHLVCVERMSRIGNHCRISSLTHLTGECLVEDEVQIGARVVTINDNDLRWRRDPTLRGAVFRKGCRVGSGVTILAGIEIGAGAMVGAGAVVTKNIPPRVLAFGVPAYIKGDAPI